MDHPRMRAPHNRRPSVEKKKKKKCNKRARAIGWHLSQPIATPHFHLTRRPPRPPPPPQTPVLSVPLLCASLLPRCRARGCLLLG